MNILKKLLNKERTLAKQRDESTKHIFRHLSELISRADEQLTTDNLFEDFIQREQLGTTYIGHGIAIPHIRSNNVNQPYGALLQLKQGIHFCPASSDNVDIFLGFVVPEKDHDQHLDILASLAEKFNDPSFRESLREAQDSLSLYKAATR